MYEENDWLKEKVLEASLLTVWELYEYLNEEDLDLTEDDFWNLLYEYLDWSLTIEKLEEDFNVPRIITTYFRWITSWSRN